METMARMLQVNDCGTLLLQRSYAPYILCCLLPLAVIKRPALADLRLEANVQVRNNQPCLELNVYMEEGRSTHHYQFFTPCSTHPDFLDSLSQASALYLLTGLQHPIDPLTLSQNQGETDTSNSLYQRVYEGGIAVEITESVREQIRTVQRFCETRAAQSVRTSVM